MKCSSPVIALGTSLGSEDDSSDQIFDIYDGRFEAKTLILSPTVGFSVKLSTCRNSNCLMDAESDEPYRAVPQWLTIDYPNGYSIYYRLNADGSLQLGPNGYPIVDHEECAPVFGDGHKNTCVLQGRRNAGGPAISY
jgi:hypothetical protein